MIDTTFKLVVSAAEEEPVLVPDTGHNMIGSTSAMGGKQMVFAIFAIVGVVLATLLVVAIIRYRNKAKMGFSLKASKGTMVFRSLLALAALGGLGFGANFLYNVMAVSQVDFTSKGEITVSAQLKSDDSVIACGSDEIKIAQALPAGYKLNMQATPLALAEESEETTGRGEAPAEDEAVEDEAAEDEAAEDEAAEPTEDETADDSESEAEPSEDTIVIPSMNDEFTNNTWGYMIGENGNMAAIPAADTAIRTVTTATEENDTTAVKFCVKLAPETRPGTYISTVKYSVNATTVEYELTYDANGGEFEEGEAPESQTSGATIANSYEFTVTDKTPVNEDAAAVFYGWSTTGDSLSTIYQAGDKITVTNQSNTLKAVWGYGDYALSFNANDDTDAESESTPVAATNMPEAQKCIITDKEATSCQVTITSQAPLRTGYTFLGWSDTAFTPDEDTTLAQAQAAVTRTPGSELTLSANKELFAVWWDIANNPDYQAELRWDQDPRDLDAHLTVVNNSDGTKVTEVYYHRKNATVNEGTIKLDVDDTSSYGPETLTLTNFSDEDLENYTFYYWARHFAGDGTIKTSGAKVVLIKQDGTTTEYDVALATPENSEDRIWNVFAIKNGQIVERNTVTMREELNY